MKTKKCKKCGQVFTPAYDTELYCSECQEEYVEQEREEEEFGWEQRHGFSNYDLDELMEDDEDDE